MTTVITKNTIENKERRAEDPPEPEDRYEAARLPEQVSVALEEVTAEVGDDLLILAVGTGLRMMTAMMELK